MKYVFECTSLKAKISSILFLCMLPVLSMCQEKQKVVGSDAKATAIVDKVVKNMGGQKAWDNTRFLAWTWRNQYHVWDKSENNFRWEKDTLVVITNLNTRQGKAYSKGREITNEAAGQKLIENMYPVWANNSYWFIMPFKLKDNGVNLQYKGTGTTQAGEQADLLELTFEKVGVTPDNRYILAVDKKTDLITEWSYFKKYTDEKPGFTMPWTSYQTYGKIKVSSGRGDAKMGITDIAVSDKVPAAVFNSPTPITKIK